jgi:hypothetical protein
MKVAIALPGQLFCDIIREVQFFIMQQEAAESFRRHDIRDPQYFGIKD